MANNATDSDYTDLCSARTIFSNEKGFFGEMFDCIKSNCDADWIQQTFDAASSDMDKLKLVYDEPRVSDTLLGTLEHVTPVYRDKDACISFQRRVEGEKLFTKAKSSASSSSSSNVETRKECETALLLLTQAVLRAPAKGKDIRCDGGLTLAMAHWFRSAILLQLNRPADALVDIQCAIDNGLERYKSKPEYFGRLAKANALNRDKCKTQICLNLAKSIYVGSGRTNDFNQLKREIEDIENNPNISSLSLTSSPASSSVDAKVPGVSGGEHKKLKGASRKMELCASRDCGNFAVAKETIKAGEMLVVEQPIAACVLPKYFGSHCLHCMKRIITAYGCTNCAGVAFCSPSCASIACSTHHRFECKFMDLLVGSGMSILCFIALRMITQYTDVSMAIAENRRIIHELCSHSERRKSTDYFQRTVMSAFLLRILQKADYFGRRTSESAYPNSIAEFEIGEILIGLLQVLQFNAHEICDLVHSDNATNAPPKYGRFLYIGAAIYHSAAYFNHNCYPAVTRYFIGQTIVLCATRPLDAGTVIAENYGPIFTRQTLRERQRSLSSRYWFRCECVSCTENWPTLDKLDDNARLRCPTNGCATLHKFPAGKKCRTKCGGCKCDVNLEPQIATKRAAEDLYSQAAQSMVDRNPRAAAIAFINGINLFYTVAAPPHRSTHIAQESLRTCLAAIGHI